MRPSLEISALLLSISSFGQAQIAFEVASIKAPAPQPAGTVMVATREDGSRVSYTNYSLRMLLARAYQMKVRQIAGPEWLDSTRFDVAAKLPDGSEKQDSPAFMRALLIERFKLAAHPEQRASLIYGLIIGKSGIKVEPAKPAAPDGAEKSRAQGLEMTVRQASRKLHGDASFATLASALSDYLDRSVIDETKTAGIYSIRLEWATDNSGSDLPTIFAAVQEQLGLRLEPRRGPVDTIVVDKMEKLPTEN